MMRRKRNSDTGMNTYFNENEIIGSGLMSDLASKLFSKITSDTSKKLGQIAAEKIISKGSEEIGTAVGKKLAKKIEGKKIEGKKIEGKVTTEVAGNKIVKLLQEYNKQIKQPVNKYADISQKFDKLLLS